MTTERKKSALSYIPGYTNNVVLQLIIALSVAYVMLGVTWGIMMIVYQDGSNFNTYFIPNLALPVITDFKSHWWTIFTSGLFNFPNGFWELLSNMLWLYCFGSVVQMLVGPKQVIPLYIYTVLTGSLFYIAAQLLPGGLGKVPIHYMGPHAGLMGMAVAAVTLTPRYRFYLSETFSIPLLAVAGVFTLLMLIASHFYLPIIIMMAMGGVAGFLYIKILKAGYRPGYWMYSLTRRIERLATPAPNAEYLKHSKQRNKIISQMYQPRQGITQQRIDDLLDKINQKGYNALTSEEKDILMRAAKEQ